MGKITIIIELDTEKDDALLERVFGFSLLRELNRHALDSLRASLTCKPQNKPCKLED